MPSSSSANARQLSISQKVSIDRLSVCLTGDVAVGMAQATGQADVDPKSRYFGS